MNTASSSELMRTLLALAEKKVARRTGEHRLPSPEAIAQEMERRQQAKARAAAGAVEQAKPEEPAAPTVVHPPQPTVDGLSLAEVQYRVIERTHDVPEAANRVVDLLCLIAMADGRIDEAETEALAAVIKTLMGTQLHEAVVKHLIRASVREIQSDGFEKRITRIGEMLRQCSLAEEGLVLAVSIAFVGDTMTAPERAMLKYLATELAIVPQRFEHLVERTAAQLRGAR